MQWFTEWKNTSLCPYYYPSAVLGWHSRVRGKEKRLHSLSHCLWYSEYYLLLLDENLIMLERWLSVACLFCHMKQWLVIWPKTGLAACICVRREICGWKVDLLKAIDLSNRLPAAQVMGLSQTDTSRITLQPFPWLSRQESSPDRSKGGCICIIYNPSARKSIKEQHKTRDN